MAQGGLVPIGELARRTGAATSALRWYERIGLLPPAERVALIHLYQDAGFTLAEIGRMLAASSQGRRGWGDLAARKIAELDARIADAQQAKKLIEHALECPHRDLLACPRFQYALQAQLQRPRNQHQ